MELWNETSATRHWEVGHVAETRTNQRGRHGFVADLSRTSQGNGHRPTGILGFSLPTATNIGAGDGTAGSRAP